MKKGKVVIIGSGRSGRGLLGELSYQDGYEITFADIDQELINKLNKNKKYISFKEKGDGTYSEIIIKDFKAYHIFSDREKYIEALTNADIIFTATFNDAFDQIIKDLQEAIDVHISRNTCKKTMFVVGANYVGLYDYFFEHINSSYTKKELEYFEKNIALIESIIYRMSSFPTQEQKAIDELSIQNENYDYLRVNENHLAKANQKMIPSFFLKDPDTKRYMQMKIWRGNTLHCSLAFMGNYYGLTYVCDAANNKYIADRAFKAYKEANKGLTKEYGLEEDDKGFGDEFLSYCKDYGFKDANNRVGNDPIRKLSRNDRFIGPALICIKNNIIPKMICQNAAYGFFFRNDSDSRNLKLKEKIEKDGIEKTIQDVCGLDVSKESEKILYDMILAKYNELLDSKNICGQ